MMPKPPVNPVPIPVAWCDVVDPLGGLSTGGSPTTYRSHDIQDRRP